MQPVSDHSAVQNAQGRLNPDLRGVFWPYALDFADF
jgi:hypothetical protein